MLTKVLYQTPRPPKNKSTRKPRSETQRIPFSQARIAGLSAPASGQIMVHDADLRGLAVRISAGGTKSFEVFKRVRGFPARVTLGRFPTLNVETARKLARKELNRMAEGINPNEEKRKERDEANRDLAFGVFFEEYVKRHAEQHTRGGAEKARRAFRLHLKPWARRSLSSITHRDLQDLHSRIARAVPLNKKDGSPAQKQLGGPRAANLAVGLVRHMFNKARSWGYYSGDNPAQNLERFPENARERWLRPDEVPAFFEALASEPSSTMRDIFLTLLLTGQRKGNVLGMRWEHLHLNRGTWEIPATETKARNRIEVQLHPHLVEMLRQREAARIGEEPYVFSGTGKTGHVQEIKKAWKKLLNRAGLTNLRPHDLRHTWASWQVASGVHLRVIGTGLGHLSPQTVNRYAHVDAGPVRQAVQQTGDALLVAGGVKRPAKVIKMPKRQRKGGK